MKTISLAHALLALKTPAQCQRFLTDLCTPAEIRALTERWAIAQWLDKSDLPYREIATKLGASVTTVGRVARFLREEPHQGYRLVLDHLASPQTSNNKPSTQTPARKKRR
ncbi:MAG: YerC/YecD family TrpR-related protein [Pseudomonadota bacterium]